jgi:hypothetical protein
MAEFPVAQDCSDLVLVGGDVLTTGTDVQAVCEPANLAVKDLHPPQQEIDEGPAHDLLIDAVIITNTAAAPFVSNSFTNDYTNARGGAGMGCHLGPTSEKWASLDCYSDQNSSKQCRKYIFGPWWQRTRVTSPSFATAA